METLLIIVVAILGIIAITQVVRVFELSSALKGDDVEETKDKDNQNQGWLLLLFLIFMIGSFIWMMFEYGDVLLPKSASEHGVHIDNLMWISMGLIMVAFFITQPLLFAFSYMFRGKKGRKASYMEHNNKLELFWTGVPAVVLAGLILYGLTTWSDITNPKTEEEPMVVEIYSYQFNWKARYSGEDNKLGYAHVRNIEGSNSLGIDSADGKAQDDIVTTELHLPVDRPVLFKFRSQDVIHSAYMPHFRMQMNSVPGTQTQFRIVPSVTTAEMRRDPDVEEKVSNINELRAAKGEDPWKFDYVLLCNKICGSAHYNMQMKVVVETEEKFQSWLDEQKTFAEL